MIDIFILIIIVWSLFTGWRNGLLKEVVSSVGFLVGLFVAATCYSTLGEYLAVDGSEANMFTSIVAFFILWIIVPIGLGFVANILTSALKGMHLGRLNSTLGAVVALIKYGVLLSCALNVMSALRIIDQQKAAESRLYEPVCGIVKTLIHHAVAPAPEESTASDTTWVEFNPAQGSTTGETTR